MESPSYYAVIPANVRYADIPPNAKLLYGELTALCSKEGYCWASNAYFSRLYNVAPTTISEWVRVLCEQGFIGCKVIEDQGNQRRIWVADGLREKPKRSSGKAEDPSSGKAEDNNTSMKTTKNNTPKAPKGAEAVNGDFEDFWKEYPNKVGKPAALKAFLRAKPDQQQLLNGLESWKLSESWRKDKGRFIPHPTTFLNQRRWEDMPNSAAPPQTDLERRNAEFMASFIGQPTNQKQIA